MFPKIKLNPITKKRVQRFKSLKRSYYSFWILIALYALGLIAELLCNNIPLYVSYKGESFFPLFKYYGEDQFVEGGHQTRPNYRALSRSPQFAENEGNYMVFPLIAPYGPNEVIDPREIDIDANVKIEFKRQQLVGSLDVMSDLTIRKATAAAPLLGAESDRALRRAVLSDFIPVSDNLIQAIDARIANQANQPELKELVELASGQYAELTISAYTPRSREPRTVRVTLREAAVAAASFEVSYGRSGELIETLPDVWTSMNEDQLAGVQEKAIARYERAVPPLSLSIAERQYRVEFNRAQVFYPFAPTDDHIFGLDHIGRDVGVRVLYALRIALNFGILLVFSSMIVGVTIGGLQGYIGGKLDMYGQRFIEIWASLPFLYIMILLGSVMGRSFLLLLVVYGLFNWIGISYYMRGEFFKLRKQPFVEAAHCIGLPGWKIMLRHMLPNGLVPIVTFFPFSLVGAIASLGALDFLGFGLPPPTPSWGELLSQAQEFKYAWWLVLYPSLALFLVVLLGVFVGEGIRAAFDPRVNSRYES